LALKLACSAPGATAIFWLSCEELEGYLDDPQNIARLITGIEATGF